jgi:hypothetical protein
VQTQVQTPAPRQHSINMHTIRARNQSILLGDQDNSVRRCTPKSCARLLDIFRGWQA